MRYRLKPENYRLIAERLSEFWRVSWTFLTEKNGKSGKLSQLFSEYDALFSKNWLIFIKLSSKIVKKVGFSVQKAR